MKVVIVDDDPLVASSLKIILEQDQEIQVCATCTSGREAVKLATQSDLSPDIMLMDIRMDDMNGLEAAERIMAENKGIRIIFLTTFLDDEYISRALGTGAAGYILKQDCASLPSAVKAVAGGQIVYGGKIVEKLPDLLNRTKKFDYEQCDIGEREQEIIRLVAEGLSNKEIAETLYLGEGTVRNLVSSVLSKLELRDRTQLAVFYYQRIV